MLCCWTAAAAADDEWVLQVGYFAVHANAVALAEQLNRNGHQASVVEDFSLDEPRYRVVSGGAQSIGELEDLRRAILDAEGIEGYAVRNPLTRAIGQGGPAAEDADDPRRLAFAARQSGLEQAPGSGSRRSDYATGAGGELRPPAPSAGFTWAGLQILPTLGITFGWDDNLTLASHDEIDSTFYVISPAVRVELPSDHSVLALTARYDMIRYADSPIDDADPWSIRADYAWDVSVRQDLGLFAEYTDGQDRRGEGRRQGNQGLIAIEPDEWTQWDYGGIWRYGSLAARGRLELKAGAGDLSYSNNRQATRFLDRDWFYWGGTFYWRLAPKTSALLEYQHTDHDYERFALDSEDERWLLGVTWDLSARTSGTLKYGKLTKDFDDPSREDYDGPTWTARLDWRPRSYSMFSLTGNRSTHEAEFGGDYILRRDVVLSWQHDWATRFYSVVDLGWGRDSYRPLPREDDLFYWDIGVRYQYNPHIRLGAGIKGYERDSSDGQFTYDRRVFLVTLEGSL